MKLKQQDNEIHVPSKFTHGLRGEDKEAMEAMYKNSVSVLRRIKSLIEREIEDIVNREELIDPQDHMHYVKSVSTRSALKSVLNHYFPDGFTVEVRY